jgi:hypothetical protein
MGGDPVNLGGDRFQRWGQSAKKAWSFPRIMREK